MDVVGSEIGQKMRSAIKAKLTELGCYVDDELPDYVMVMVANKRTRAQMEDDLQLFLGDNTELFVNWLHQVLKKLQEVTVPPLKPVAETTKEKPKEKKSKDKKDKNKDKSKQKKVESAKKSKKKDKVKEKLRKKEEKKSHKSKDKKKSKHHGMIRPNIPPLLMNIEKESEPSITDVFAGQILKNHGILIEETPKDVKPETKPVVREINKPIIDPASISSQPESNESATTPTDNNVAEVSASVSTAAPRDEQIKEMNEIEAKIQGLKQKLAEQLDSMSEDEDFLNIRTEAEELMNDFAEDVFQEISSQAPPATTPPLSPTKPPTTAPESPAPKASETPEESPVVIESPKPVEPETLPQIELKLPKRPVRERLGAKEDTKKTEGSKEKEVSKLKSRLKSPERFTPEREPDFWGKYKSARSRLGSPPEATRKSPITFKRRSSSDNSDDSESSSNKKERKGSGAPARVSCASVVRVKPRPRAHVPSSLLLRAVADAHKSLLNIPPKITTDPPKIKRALVHPMRRLDGPNIVIQIPAERPASLGREDEKRNKIDLTNEEYTPSPLGKKPPAPAPALAPAPAPAPAEYVSSRSASQPLAPISPLASRDRISTKLDDTLIIETINIHNPTVDKDKKTQFIVTMDGFNPNAFLAKKLKTEGLLDEDIELTPNGPKSVLKISPLARDTDNENKNKPKEIDKENDCTEEKDYSTEEKSKIDDAKKKPAEEEKQGIENIETTDGGVTVTVTVPQKKRLSDTSDDSDTQVIITTENISERVEKRNSVEAIREEESAPKKRKASPIVFDVVKKDGEQTESASSDHNVKVTTQPNTHKYDALPPLSAAEKRPWCRAFPLCRYGAACAFLHPRCKFAASCTRRGCVYSHAPAAPVSPQPASPQPALASHVVAPASYKSVRAPAVCAFAPHCTNALCGFAHPPPAAHPPPPAPARPCRYGRACAHRDTCNFAHPHAPPTSADRWRYPV